MRPSSNMEVDASALGKRIRKERKKRGWTRIKLSDQLGELAGEVGPTRCTIGRWEAGTQLPLRWLAHLYVLFPDLR